MSAHADDGSACNDQEGYKCVFGACRSDESSGQLAREMKELDLVSFNLGIRSAFVADRDPYPGQGESDAFVVVEMASNAGPSYNESELVCHTHVVQDSSRPKWQFVCRPLPVRSEAKLRFVVMDSDKPDTQPQLLGQASQSVALLLNAGPQTLILEHPSGKIDNGGPYWLEVELKGQKYRPLD